MIHCVRRASFVTGLALIALLASCVGTRAVSELPAASARGHTPWVFRSVLDRRPRMITLALSPQLWAAYDTQNAALYKVWRDGVEFDGAVYTTRHGPQPTAHGAGYIVHEPGSPWRLSVNGRIVEPKVQYRGHRFEDGHVYLQYSLTSEDGERVELRELPEAWTDAGRPGFFRRFEILSNPRNAKVQLITSFQSLSSLEAIRTNAELDVTSTAQRDGAIDASAILTLAPRVTTLVVPFTAEPRVAAEAPEAPPNPAVTFMEGSDCNVCHNPHQQTIGPSFGQIARRYKTTPQTIDLLAQKIINGGAGVWGDVMMTPHPNFSMDEARMLARYILNFDPEDKEGIASAPPSGAMPQAKLPAGHEAGVTLRYYEIADPIAGVPVIDAGQQPSKVSTVPQLSLTMNPSEVGEYGFEEFQSKRKFVLHASGVIHVPRSGTYRFRLDDGSGDARLFIGSRKLIETQANSSPHASLELKRGSQPFTIEYANSPFADWHTLQFFWQPPGESEAIVPAAMLSTPRADRAQVTPGFKRYTELPPVGVPGDQLPLQAVHPSLRLVNIRPAQFQPKVAGMDFLSDGRLVISTWSAEGGVYVLDGIQGEDPAAVTVKQIAAGLAEPLGLKVVDDEIYVLQKQELTHLIDHDGDELIDEYRTVSNDWSVTDNFHEFAFGLLYEDGGFYVALASAILPGGAPAKPQAPDRGKLLRIDRQTGQVETVARGLRTPNGLGRGVDGEMFIADNQGNWLPSSKIVHVRRGAFYGFRAVDPVNDAKLEETPPVVWLPQDEIGNSPTNPVPFDVGVYKGQMLHGEVTHGGLKRVFVEKVNGAYQGCVFRFSQGLEAGVNRTIWGPDGALYVGGIGNPGNWGHAGKLHYGLQKLVPTDASAFEMLAIRVKANGLEIEFTEPLRPGDGLRPEDYEVRSWRYVPDENYGGPKIDERTLPIKSVRVSDDRRRSFLELEGIAANRVLYVRIANPFVSSANAEMWSTESWCTVNGVPDARGVPGEVPRQNTLTEAERAAGWQLLFDGRSIGAWRNFNGRTLDARWKAINGALTLTAPGGGDIVTKQEFDNFELQFEWRLAAGGNSGLFYNVVEGVEAMWQAAPEMQILDDDAHPDGRIPNRRAGSNYDLHVPRYSVTKPVGQYNIARLIVRDGHVEHWLNGRKLVEYELWSKEWEAGVAASKFAELLQYGRARRGHLGLQDHGDWVAFRNIKIRPL